MRSRGRLMVGGAVVWMLFYGFFLTHASHLQICFICNGTIVQGSAVWDFCTSSAGQMDGRCCLQKDISSAAYVTGIDMSHCNMTSLEDLSETSSAVVIDLSGNPITNINDAVFQGFSELTYLALPANLPCPGGNVSWHNTTVQAEARICEGQISACNQTGQMSWDCPQNSLCSPYGPGFAACSCSDPFHGYKCLREGEFPTVKVLSILGGSTTLMSAVLWVTQRRKAKSM